MPPLPAVSAIITQVGSSASIRSAASHEPGRLATGLARRLGLGPGDVGRYLMHEVLKVAQALQPVDDY